MVYLIYITNKIILLYNDPLNRTDEINRQFRFILEKEPKLEILIKISG